jgi:hypothetical protein
MRGHAIRYSRAELKWLERNHKLPIAKYAENFRAKFGRDDVKARHLHALRRRKGWKTGRTGRFEKGQEPANKGKRCAEGKGGRHPNSRKTQFKKGALPPTYRGPGYERVDEKVGYVILIVAETNPHTGAKTRPVLKHRWLWEKANGPVPAGHALKCLDGNRTNCDPSNWVAVPRALLPRLAGRWRIPYDTAPDELKPAIMAVAKLEHSLREKKGEHVASASVQPKRRASA